MNLLQLVEACEVRSGYNDTAFRSTWKSFINEGVESFARKYPWPGLESYCEVLADGTRFLTLPHYVDTLLSLTDRTNHVPVDRTAEVERRHSSIVSQRTSGTAQLYDKIGIVPTFRDPTPTSAAQFFSTHASDTAQLCVTGYAAVSGASGTPLTYQLKTYAMPAGGLTPQTITSAFSSFVSISKATETLGDYYVVDGGATEYHISVIPKDETEAAFKRLHLVYVPPAGTVFEARFRTKIPRLREDAQAPHPAVDSSFVVDYALGCYFRSKEQFSKGQLMDQRSMMHLQDRANKEENFDESWSQITPYVPNDGTPYSDR